MIALVACEPYPHLGPDDRHLLDALDAAGLRWEIRRWDEPDTAWDRYAAVVLRAPWDYYRRPEEFSRWIEERRRDGSRVWNPLDAVVWNMRKEYLRELGAAGVATVETEWLDDAGSISDALARRGWRRAVAKPVVSAGAWATSVVTPEAIDGDLPSGPVMLQPFLDAIVEEGEWSFVFIDGSFSHASLKTPARGDFRVQEAYGGSTHPADPPAALLADAAHVLEHAPSGLLYARVDGIRENDRLLLIELEIFEPALYFETAPGSAARFARALAERL